MEENPKKINGMVWLDAGPSGNEPSHFLGILHDQIYVSLPGILA